MKKVITVVLFLLVVLCISTTKVNAKMIESRQVYANNSVNLKPNDNATINCSGFFDADAAKLINEILDYVRIAAPILMIILTSVDFAQAVLSSDNDAMKKATSKVTKRAIATALLFLVPTIIKAIFNLPGLKGTLVKTDDPLCGTMASAPIVEEYYQG